MKRLSEQSQRLTQLNMKFQSLVSSSIIVLCLLKTYIVVHVRTSEAVLASTQRLCFRANKMENNVNPFTI